MNKIFYFFVKDLYKLRWLLALWLLCLGGFFFYYHSGDQPDFRLVNHSYVWDLFFQIFPMLIFVSAIHADSPIGSTSFWQTRPISIYYLLLAKLLFALALLLPLMMMWHWLVVGVYQTTPGITFWTTRNVASIIFFFWLGAVTRNLLQALGLMVLLCVIYTALTQIAVNLNQTIFSLIGTYLAHYAGIVILLIGGIYQFKTRKTVVTICGTILLLLIFALISMVLPREKLRSDYLSANHEKAQVAYGHIVNDKSGWLGCIYYSGQLVGSSIPKNSFFCPTKILPAFRTADGRLIPINNQSSYSSTADFFIAAIRVPAELLPSGAHYTIEDAPHVRSYSLIKSNAFPFRKLDLKNRQGTLFAKVEGDVCHYELLATVPVARSNYTAFADGKARVMAPDPYRLHNAFGVLVQKNIAPSELEFVLYDPQQSTAAPLKAVLRKFLARGKFCVYYWEFMPVENISLVSLKDMQLLIYRKVLDKKLDLLLEEKDFTIPFPRCGW